MSGARRLPPAVLVMALLPMAAVATSSRAQAQTSGELDAARRLFADAMADEQASRFSAAVEKYQGVARVKDTPNVRFRIGTCLEAMGHLVEAEDAYRNAVSQGTGDAGAVDTVHAARDRVTALDARIAHLTLTFAEPPPPDLALTVDGAPVSSAASHQPIAVDPGRHVIEARADGRKPLQQTVSLAEGGSESLSVVLATEAPAAPTGQSAPMRDVPPAAATDSAHGPPTSAWIAFGAGALLAGGAAVALGVRESSISSIHGACGAATSSGALDCPASQQSTIDDERNRAQIMGPLAAGLGAGALLAVGLGGYLWWSNAPTQRAWLAPGLTPGGASFIAGGTWR